MDVRRGDTVLVLAGKDRGKRGTVDRVEKTKRGFGVVVAGINMAKRHQRARSRTQPAGIIDLAGAAPHQQRAGRSARAATSRPASATASSRASTAAARASASAAASRSR